MSSAQKLHIRTETSYFLEEALKGAKKVLSYDEEAADPDLLEKLKARAAEAGATSEAAREIGYIAQEASKYVQDEGLGTTQPIGKLPRCPY